MIRFRCQHCNRKVKAEDHLLNRKVRCPACRNTVFVLDEAFKVPVAQPVPIPIDTGENLLDESGPVPVPGSPWWKQVLSTGFDLMAGAGGFVLGGVEAVCKSIADDFRKAQQEKLELQANYDRAISRYCEVIDKGIKGTWTEQEEADFHAIQNGLRQMRATSAPRVHQPSPRVIVPPPASRPLFEREQQLANEAIAFGERHRDQQYQLRIAEALERLHRS